MHHVHVIVCVCVPSDPFSLHYPLCSGRSCNVEEFVVWDWKKYRYFMSWNKHTPGISDNGCPVYQWVFHFRVSWLFRVPRLERVHCILCTCICNVGIPPANGGQILHLYVHVHLGVCVQLNSLLQNTICMYTILYDTDLWNQVHLLMSYCHTHRYMYIPTWYMWLTDYFYGWNLIYFLHPVLH